MNESVRFQYFQHQLNARKDEKLRKLLIKEGWEGIGLFWGLLEELGLNKEHRLQTDYEELSFDMHASAEKIQHVVENYGLFKVKSGYFYNSSLTGFLDDLEEKYKKRAAAGKKGGAAKAMLKQSQSNATAMPEQCQPTKEKIREEESRIDTPCDVSLSNDKENTQGVGDNTPTQQFVLEKKKNFIMVAMTCEGDYPKQLRKSFADYWTQPLQADPSRMLFEEKRAFDIPTQLRRWAEMEHPGKRTATGKKEEVISYDQYYKRYGTTLCQDGWQTRHNPIIGKMEYYRPLTEE